MPPTFKDTDLSSSEVSTTRPGNGGGANEAAARQQKVALEVPVTVNGARAVEGSDKREPFAEATKTVLVHGAGAVIRLASAVTPGQLLFLTNDKTKKEVVCQVLKSKSDGAASGYVELQFTEPVHGFWGLGFPGERSAAPVAARPAVLPALGQGLDSRAPLSSTASTPAEPNSASSAVEVQKPVDPAEKFKTEIKQESRHMSKADFLTPADNSTQALKLEASRLQEQLSSLLFADPAANDSPNEAPIPTPTAQNLSDTAAKVLELAKDEPAPRKAEPVAPRADSASPANPPAKIPLPVVPAFDAEEVKIPAWLEPLARNAAIPAPPEPASPAPIAAATPASTSEFEELSAAEPEQHASAAAPRAAAPASFPGPRAASTPVFGRTLLGTSANESARRSSGGKGILITAIAAGVVLASAGVTWYLRQSASPASVADASSALPASTSAEILPAPRAAKNSVPSLEANTGTVESSAREAKPVSTASTPAKLQPAAISERVPKPAASVDASKTPEPSMEAAEPETTRPNLGKVRLAKPKVARSARTPLTGDAAPTLEADGEQLAANGSPLSGGLLEAGANQPAAPAAPLAVGGDVKPARMLSSVPPSYPMLARSQHIAGDVRIDALIDANGRVSTMKVVSGPTLLHQAAMDALRQWRYQAATLDGKPVAMHLTVTIQFRLQ